MKPFNEGFTQPFGGGWGNPNRTPPIRFIQKDAVSLLIKRDGTRFLLVFKTHDGEIEVRLNYISPNTPSIIKLPILPQEWLKVLSVLRVKNEISLRKNNFGLWEIEAET